jgi:hypothetical protein
MCLIAQRTNTGAHIPNDYIDYNLTLNPDGFGIAWRDPMEGLLYEKFAPSAKAAFKDLLKQIDHTNYQYTAHWRKATHGPACLELAHPFSYVDASGVPILAFHNGIIDIKTTANESDTQVFVDSVLANLEYGWWNNPAMMWLVEESIGWSRMLLMLPDEDVIINPKAWTKDGGLLYSTTPHYKGATRAANLPLWGTAGASTGTKVVTGIQSSVGTTNSLTTTGIGSVPNSKVDADNDEYIRLLREISEDSGDMFLSWKHNGHEIEPISQIDSTSKEIDDKYGQAICAQCRTEGEYYIVDGVLVIEIDHLDEDDENDMEVEEALLPRT